MTEYQKHQLQWMLEHNVSLQQLAKWIDEYIHEITGENSDIILKSLEDYLLDVDFAGVLWANKGE